MASEQNKDAVYARQTVGAEAKEEDNDKNRAGPTWCSCAGGEVCRKQKIVSRRHAPGQCGTPSQKAKSFGGMCRACAPDARGRCQCRGGDGCRRADVNKHEPLACKANVQEGSVFANMCEACAPRAPGKRAKRQREDGGARANGGVPPSAHGPRNARETTSIEMLER